MLRGRAFWSMLLPVSFWARSGWWKPQPDHALWDSWPLLSRIDADVTEIKVETQAFICFSHRLWVNCYLNLDPRDLLWLSLGLAQEDTLHGALDHLDQNHKVLEMSQERMFTTDFQTVGMSSSVIIRKNMMPLKEVSKPQKLRRTETMFDLVPI